MTNRLDGADFTGKWLAKDMWQAQLSTGWESFTSTEVSKTVLPVSHLSDSSFLINISASSFDLLSTRSADWLTPLSVQPISFCDNLCGPIILSLSNFKPVLLLSALSSVPDQCSPHLPHSAFTGPLTELIQSPAPHHIHLEVVTWSYHFWSLSSTANHKCQL